MRNKLIVFVFMILVCQTFLLAATGDLDLSFGDNGIFISAPSGANDYATSVAMQSDGKIVVGGYNDVGTNGWFKLIRLNQDGTLDNSFGNNGNVGTDISSNYEDFCEDICIQPDGKIVAVGRTSNGPSYHFVVVRYNSDGSLDTSFDSDGIVITYGSNGHDYARSVLVQPDGKILVAGNRHNGSFNEFAIIRYNSDGSLDTSFGSNGIKTIYIRPTNHYGDSIVLQDDGKIVLCGTYINDQASDRYELAVLRFNVDGTVDQEFGNAGLVTKAISSNTTWGYSTKVQSDGKIVIGGTYQSVSTGTDQYIIRLNTDGSFDNTFGLLGVATITLSEFGEEGRSIYIQEDGKLLIGGYSIGLSNFDLCITRLNSDGTIDSSFNHDGMVTTDINNGNDFAYDITIQNDAKIILIGDGEIIDSNRKILIARYFGSDLSVVYNVVQDGSGDFTGIQTAIDYANNGDTILVHPGTYVENIDFNGKDIVVGSLFLTTQDTSYISSTIIDGNQAGRVVIFNSNESPSTCLIGLTITNGSITGAGATGGGIFISNANPTIKYVNVTNCWADADGGGIQLTHSNSLLNNIYVFNNNADEGGGGINCHYSNSIIMNSIIRSNSTNGKGGGLHIGANSDPVLQNLLIVNNSAQKGGGIDVYGSSFPQIINCTISSNISTYGGGIYLDTDANPFLINSILWDNTPQEIEINNIIQTNTITVSYSDVKGGETAIVETGNGVINWEIGNIDIYPSFIDTINSNFTLSNFSPCIGMGLDTIIVPSTDINGSLRPNPTDSNPDMGAYENSLGIRTNMLFSVKTDGTGDYTIIQSAIDASLDDDTVLVYPGTYIENINFNGKNIVVGSLFLTSQDTSYISLTIIDGNQSSSVVTIESGEDSTAILSGFTIQNGSNQFGGGIKCINSNPTFKNLIISGNYASDSGGGLYSSNSNIHLVNSRIITNEAIVGAGIKTLNNSEIFIVRARIVNNISTSGHTLDIYESIASISYSDISNNSAGNSGAPGINCFSCSLSVFNSNIVNNTTSSIAGGLLIGGGGTIADSYVELHNTIIWGNVPDQIRFWETGQTGTLLISYSDVQDDQSGIYIGATGIVNWGDGNISQYPGFIDSSQSDYSLNIGSPCIDAGDPDLDSDQVTWETDIDDQDPDGTRLDMGAYYYHQTIIDSANTDKVIVISHDGSGRSYDYNTDSWASITSTSTFGDISMAAAYDVESDRMIVVGYQGIASAYNHNSDQWEVISDPGGWGGNQIVAAYDVESDRVIAVSATGGTRRSYDYNTDTWENISDPLNFSQIGMAAAYDLESDRVICFQHDGSGRSYDYNTDSWAPITSTSTFGDISMAAAYDVESDRTIVVGYNEVATAYNYNIDQWEDISDPGGWGGNQIVAAYDVESDRVIAVSATGGTRRSYDYNSDTWAFIADPGDFSEIGLAAAYVGEIAYESPYLGPVWHIATTGSDATTGDGSELSPFATIQHGINESSNGDTVLVYPGTYVENINFNGKNIVVGSLLLTTQDTSYISSTVIDGNQNGSVVTFESGENTTATLIGFVLTGGIGNPYNEYYQGGGIFCTNSNPTFNSLQIRNNSISGALGQGHGGGIYFNNSNSSIKNSFISNNTSNGDGGGIFTQGLGYIEIFNVQIIGNSALWNSGGGIYSNSTDISINTCIIKNNNASSNGGGISLIGNSNSSIISTIVDSNSVSNQGGGISLHQVDMLVSKCEITNNIAEAGSGGGGIYMSDSDPILNNNIIFGNQAIYGGGITISQTSNPILINNTIAFNSASINGGGFYLRLNSNLSLLNSIIWDNFPQQVLGSGSDGPNSVDINYSLIENGTGLIDLNNNGTVSGFVNNILIDPHFVDMANGDYHLGDFSPAIGSGTTTGAPLEDIDGNPRPNPSGSNPDMGAYENPLAEPNATYITGGTISTDSTWSLSKSPYIISGDVLVDNGATLTIEPGVEVLFDTLDNDGITHDGENHWEDTEKIEFIVKGHLSAIGTEQDSIYFNSLAYEPASGDYSTLFFYPSSQSDTLKYFKITYGKHLYTKRPIYVSNSFFNKLSNEGIYYVNGNGGDTTKIINNYFGNSNGAIASNGDCYAIILNNTIELCNTGLDLWQLSSAEVIQNSFISTNINITLRGEVSSNFSHNNFSGQFNNNTIFDISAKNNYWGPTATIEMSAGSELRNISTIHDYFDFDTLGVVDYSQFLDTPWPGGEPVFPELNLITVKTDGTGDYTVIQTAIDATIDGDTVIVHPGTYVENINFNGKNIVVGSLFLTTQDTSYISSTIIDGNQSGSVVTFESGEDTTTTIVGFMITNGLNNNGGGGIVCDTSTPILDHLTIMNCSSLSLGGGIYCSGSSDFIIRNCVINENTSNNYGGAIFVEGSNIQIINSIIANNDSQNDGPIDLNGSICTITNSNIISNDGNVGGIFCSGGNVLNLINSIIRDNHPNQVYLFPFDESCTVNVYGCNVTDGVNGIVLNNNGTLNWGNNNLDSDPLFTQPYSPLKLSNYSPCIGAGTDSVQIDGIWHYIPITDIDNNPRPNPTNSNPDIGAYENPLPSQLPLAQSIRDGLGDDLNWTNSATLLSSNWDPFIDDSTITYECAIGNGDSTINEFLDWTTTGTDTFATLTGLNLTSGTTYFISLRGTDIHNQMSDTVTTDGIIVDLLDPMIGELWDGDESGDIDWQNSTSEFSIYWTGSDSRVIANYWVALSNTPGDSDIVDWTDNGTETSLTFTGLNLTQGDTYYANVRAMDEAKNWSGTMSTDGVTIDGVAPIAGQIFDESNGNGTYYAATDSLALNWSGFYDEHSGIDHYELALGTSPGSSNVLPWDSIGTDTLYTITGLSLDDGLLYYASIKANDIAGNQSSIISTDGITIDISGPTGGMVADGELEDIDWSNSDFTVIGHWDQFVDEGIGVDYLEYSVGTNVGETDILDWINVNQDTSIYNQYVSIPDHNTTYYLNVRATDLLGNSSAIYNSDGVTTDYIAPNISWVYLGGYLESFDFCNTLDSLMLSTSHLYDDLSGLDDYQFAIGSTVGGIEIANWTTGEYVIEDSTAFINFTGLNMIEGISYGGSFKAVDNAGNIRSLSIPLGIIPDVSPPVVGIVIDGETEDINVSNSDSTFEANWSGFSDELSGIDHYLIGIGTTPDSNDVRPFLNTPTPGVQLLNISLSHGEQYYAIVKAVDIVGNISEPVSSDGIVVDIYAGPPTVIAMSPDPFTLIPDKENITITLYLSEPLDEYFWVAGTNNMEHCCVLSSTYFVSPPRVELTMENDVAYADTITFSLYDYIDYAGLTGDSVSYEFYTPWLADYNIDWKIDVLDLANFATHWNTGQLNWGDTIDGSYELGPVLGDVPYFTLNPDSVFDLQDLMGFTRMWNWSHQTQVPALIASGGSFGEPPIIEQNGRSLFIILPEWAEAGQIVVEYQSNTTEVNCSTEDGTTNRILLKENDIENSQLLLEYAYISNSSNKSITLDAKTLTRNNSSVTVNYTLYSEKQEILSQGYQDIELVAVPDKYALHQNYPNPFNPVTTIEYDLPENAEVFISIYDILGREVKSLVNTEMKAGYHSIQWNGTNKAGNTVSAGMYLYRISAGDFNSVKKMVLLK